MASKNYPKRSNKKRQHKEHNHQKAVFDLAKMYETQYPELKLMTGSLAGVNLGPIVGKRAKDAGHKAGFPDIHLPTAHNRWFSLSDINHSFWLLCFAINSWDVHWI